ncbi:transglutaminase family protein [Polynucleobacter necessarius]|uniref:transglutaminase family protein n=1 Tax=Polynucleobacter necessarius TaxID=576610 RepID=UPI002F92AEAF
MLLEITHDTHYAYDPNVEIAQHFAHLKPADTETQKVLNSEISVDPRPAWSEENKDSYGNVCTFFSLQSRHNESLITAKSLIETSSIDYGPKPLDTPAWELVREYFRYHSNTKWDAASEFLFTSSFITLRPEFAEFARANFTSGRPLLDAAIDLMKHIYSEFHYVSKSTDIGTPALEALKKRQGICQDFAHILIASLRSIGLPAKYISGYILTNPPPGQARLIGGDASHAWVSVYVPTLDENGQLYPKAFDVT